MELAAGHIAAISDTSLGFRHGPKIVVSSTTLVIHLISTDDYTRQYDRDLLGELKADDQASAIIELSPERLFPGQTLRLDDLWMSLVYIVYCQIFAFLHSFSLGVPVDSPCPSGEVNRVVKGVTIYAYPGVDD